MCSNSPARPTPHNMTKVIIKESQILAKKQDQLKQIIECEFNRAAANEIEAALPTLTDKFEREVYTMAIERSDGNQAKAARLLGVSRFTLREKLKLYGKHPNSHTSGS